MFVFIGMAFFLTTFFTAKEVVERDVARVSFKQTIQTVTKNGPLARLCASSLMYLTAQNVVGAIIIYYARDYLGGTASLLTLVTIITTGAVLYVGPFGPWITKVLGKKRGFMIACVGTLIGALIVYLAKTNIPMAMVGLFVIGASMGLLNTMTWALEADTVEYGEWKTHIRTEGATYAAFSFTRKVGQAAAPRWPAPPSATTATSAPSTASRSRSRSPRWTASTRRPRCCRRGSSCSPC